MNRMKMSVGAWAIAVSVCSAFQALAAGEIVVKVAKPEAISEGEGVVNVGRVMGSHSVNLSARVVGTLWERHGEEGASVRKGDVLYKIEDTIYKANLQTARAKEAELKAKLELAEVEARRYSQGELKGGVSKSDRDRIILSRDVAKAELEAARANVTLCENDLSYCTIKSPIDGILGRYNFDVGNNVGPESGTLRDIICVDPIDVVVSVPEQLLRWAFEQRDLRKSVRRRLLRSDGKEVPIDLKVYAMDNKVDAATGTVTVRFRGANPNREVMPGGYVKLVLSAVYGEPRLVVPMSAVVFEGAKRFLYICKDGKVSKREIVTGSLVGDRMEVEKGLAADESFVISGVHKLHDGANVTVR